MQEGGAAGPYCQTSASAFAAPRLCHASAGRRDQPRCHSSPAGSRQPENHDRWDICQEPRFHALDHEIHLLVRHCCGPVITLLQVYPDGFTGGHGGFGVNQQDREGVRIILQRSAKVMVRLVAASRCDDAWFWPVTQEFCEEEMKRLPARKRRPAFRVWPAAFHEYLDAHQREPPSCPLVQSSPRLY